MKDSEAMENAEYKKRTGDTTGDFASNNKSRKTGDGGKRMEDKKRMEKKR